MQYRVEQKYVCNIKELVVLQSRLKLLCKTDKNANHQNEYKVTSLYFDNYKNTLYYENEDGIAKRSKYRMRYYNDDIQNINLEIKKKHYGFTNKISCSLEPELVKDILNGSNLPLKENMPSAYKETLLKMRGGLFYPNIIVEYTREPYVYKEGNS